MCVLTDDVAYSLISDTPTTAPLKTILALAILLVAMTASGGVDAAGTFGEIRGGNADGTATEAEVLFPQEGSEQGGIVRRLNCFFYFCWCYPNHPQCAGR